MGSLWDGEICRSSAAIARIALIAFASCGAPARPAPPPPIGNTAPAAPDTTDPAHIEGRWVYRTKSTCGQEVGSGWVEFVWLERAGMYRETGEVAWPVEASTIRWAGTAWVSDRTGHLKSAAVNSLGDKVDGEWIRDGATLTIAWDQANGCTGVGVAERVRLAE